MWWWWWARALEADTIGTLDMLVIFCKAFSLAVWSCNTSAVFCLFVCLIFFWFFFGGGVVCSLFNNNNTVSTVGAHARDSRKRNGNAVPPDNSARPRSRRKTMATSGSYVGTPRAKTGPTTHSSRKMGIPFFLSHLSKFALDRVCLL